jgi:predicted  nucleic acid-binding Zn-ribbon protein
MPIQDAPTVASDTTTQWIMGISSIVLAAVGIFTMIANAKLAARTAELAESTAKQAQATEGQARATAAIFAATHVNDLQKQVDDIQRMLDGAENNIQYMRNNPNHYFPSRKEEIMALDRDVFANRVFPQSRHLLHLAIRYKQHLSRYHNRPDVAADPTQLDAARSLLPEIKETIVQLRQLVASLTKHVEDGTN